MFQNMYIVNVNVCIKCHIFIHRTFKMHNYILSGHCLLYMIYVVQKPLKSKRRVFSSPAVLDLLKPSAVLFLHIFKNQKVTLPTVVLYIINVNTFKQKPNIRIFFAISLISYGFRDHTVSLMKDCQVLEKIIFSKLNCYFTGIQFTPCSSNRELPI